MTILCIDPGINNLAMCIMSCTDKKDITTYCIELWNVYNILEEEHKCKQLQKNGKICNKKCSYKYKNDEDEEIFTCKLHFSKEHNIKQKKHSYKKKNIDQYLLQDIIKNLLKKIQEIYTDNQEIFDNLTDIFIELQPSINRKSIMVSHVLYSKFIDLFIDKKINIKFVRASKKLKAYTGPVLECKLKSAYAKRKYLSVEYTKNFLEYKFSEEQKEKWLPFFESKIIKPDMSDTFLMAINATKGCSN